MIKKVFPPVGLFAYWAVWISGFGGSVLVSAITYRFIENPLIQKGRAVVAYRREKKRIATAPAPQLAETTVSGK